MRSIRKSMLHLVGATFVAGFVASGTAAAQGSLTVYCAVNEEWCQAAVNAFQAETGIQVDMTRKSSGETYAQVVAEADNPRGDIWFGGTGDPHLEAAELGLTEEYESPMIAELHDWAVSQHQTANGRTVGIYLGVLGYGYNTELLAARNLPAPACWADLTKPDYADEIQVANPNTSGTAYNFLATIVQLNGEDAGFEYMKAFGENVSQYTRSGTAPAQAAARGETLIAIAFLHDIIGPIVTAGAPLQPVAPCEGTGFEIGSMSIIKGAPNLDNARKWYDWALTAKAQELAGEVHNYQLPSNPAAAIPEKAPKMDEIKLIEYDFAKYGSSDERRRLLGKWDAEIGAN